MLNRLPVFRFAKRIISPSRFYFANNETSQPLRTDAPKRTDTLVKEEETPVHLRPYNKEKYEVPSEKIKVHIFVLNTLQTLLYCKHSMLLDTLFLMLKLSQDLKS